MARNDYDNPNSLMSLHQEIGKEWEIKAKELLETLGYDVEFYSDCFTSPFDLLVNGKPVEVKAAYATDRDNGKGTVTKRYQANLTAKVGIEEPWFLIFVAIDDNGLQTWFFIPGYMVKTKTLSLTSHPMSYAGKWSQFRSETSYLDVFLNT